MKTYIYLSAICLILTATAANAKQNPDWLYFHDIREIVSLAADENYIWIGASVNFGGTLRLNLNTLELDTISEIPAIAIAPKGDGTAWFGTSDNGAMRFDGEGVRLFNPSNSVFPDDIVYAIDHDSRGNAWFTTQNDLVQYDGSAWYSYNYIDSLVDKLIIYSMAIDHNDYIWMSYLYRGIGAYIDGEWFVYDTTNSPILSPTVVSIAVDKEGNKWFATKPIFSKLPGELLKFNNVEWTSYNSENSGLKSSLLSCVNVDSSGKILVATVDAGLFIFDGATWIALNRNNSGLTGNSITALSIDKYGNTWFAVNSAETGEAIGLEVYRQGGVLLPVSIAEGTNLALFPNPATDYVYINLNDLEGDSSPSYNSGSGSVKIYNTLGQCVSHLTPSLSKGEGGRIDVSQWPVGVYLVRFGNKVEKFVKW